VIIVYQVLNMDIILTNTHWSRMDYFYDRCAFWNFKKIINYKAGKNQDIFNVKPIVLRRNFHFWVIYSFNRITKTFVLFSLLIFNRHRTSWWL